MKFDDHYIYIEGDRIGHSDEPPTDFDLQTASQCDLRILKVSTSNSVRDVFVQYWDWELKDWFDVDGCDKQDDGGIGPYTVIHC